MGKSMAGVLKLTFGGQGEVHKKAPDLINKFGASYNTIVLGVVA
jgi:hypothetical protein